MNNGFTRIANIAAALGLLWLAPHAAATPAEERFLHARDAYKAGERVRLARLAEALGDHELRPWVDYWRLRLKLEDSETEGVADFLEREKGSYLAEKLRGDWLRLLGKRGQWETFEKELPALAMPEPDIACHALQARLVRADAVAREAVLLEARPLWFAAVELPEACAPLMDALVVDKRLDADDIWERVRRLLEMKKLREARAAARYLPDTQIPDARTLEAIADKPARHFARLGGNFAATRLGREMALFAMQRMARQDPLPAATQWREIEKKFSEADRGYVWGHLAQQAAMRHLPEALDWFDLAGTTPLFEDQLAWKTRAALRALDWARVRQAVEQMPPRMAAEPVWSYWLGRALAAQGSHESANALFQKIAGQPNFYGNLADEELGRVIGVPPRAVPPSRDELAVAAARPGFRRALALIRLDMRVEGVREWVWTLRGLDDRQLLAAADFARGAEVWDRAINTADRTTLQHDYSLRYLAPFRERVEPKTRELALDHGWVYGLMRQESRFIQRAKSSVGAQGLMQVMPATAKWVAKKIGLAGYHPGKVTEMDTNVTLGTNYLKMVLASLDNHPVLASAAYNAGPGRARRWRADHPIEGAIYAETIPFSETRDYVKKVMSNAVYYTALFEGKPQSLKSRLGVVQPARGGDTRGEDLP
ncbi:MAG: transglycosylase SLT domain-containing protein [Sulfurisoma sp.]|nr:transglycosylase SLT domain-containing protein [Sulfurisoma sp.]